MIHIIIFKRNILIRFQTLTAFLARIDIKNDQDKRNEEQHQRKRFGVLHVLEPFQPFKHSQYLLAELGEMAFVKLAEVHHSTQDLQIGDQRIHFRNVIAITIIVTTLRLGDQVSR